jgi:NAD(P)H-hydrate epimerase
MKIFKTSQIADIDKYTIDNEPIADIDLMERASRTIANYIVEDTQYEGKVVVYCGPGNNGGDGLAVARMLAHNNKRFDVEVFILDFNKGLSGSSKINLDRIIDQNLVKYKFINSQKDLIQPDENILIIDALFGSGLNRPLEGFPAEIVKHINNQNSNVISIDIPSGLMGEDNSNNNTEHIVKASTTITFQFPKFCFMFPESEAFTGTWLVKNIGLHPAAIENTNTPYRILQENDVTDQIKPRSRFSHKGMLGHALLIAGSYGMMGAAVLSAKSALRSGLGLLTVHVPHGGYSILQSHAPEALVSIDESDIIFTSINGIEKYDAIGIGPGIGKKANTQQGLKKLINEAKVPMVLDADALNILADNTEWYSLLPKNTILTPHPKEFDRLAGKSSNSYLRLKKAVGFAQKYNLNIVLKGAHTAIINSNGDVWLNITGNPGMATGGSGDVLTGIILSLLAQGYEPFTAACVGVYIHGLAGDIAAAGLGFEALIASDITENLGKAFKMIHKKS